MSTQPFVDINKETIYNFLDYLETNLTHDYNFKRIKLIIHSLEYILMIIIQSLTYNYRNQLSQNIINKYLI